jgi:hypothetical protein
MNDNQKYFISLLSSHLNNSPPQPKSDSVDWMGVFKLGELHNVTAILTTQIKMLSAENKPSFKVMSYFNQALGMTIQRHSIKTESIRKLNEILNENKIRRIFLKGAAIRQFYPFGELRTSGDTDLFVDSENLNPSADKLIENGFDLIQRTDVQNVVEYNQETFEIKNIFDCLNSDIDNYFLKTAFNEDYYENQGEFSFVLKPIYHLVYIISHFLRHLAEGGVGIRQLMDIDVLIRNAEIDIDRLLLICTELGIDKSTKALLALSKQLFNTPIAQDFEIDENLKNSLISVILNGGVFGYAISNTGTKRMIQTLNSDTDKKKYKL